MKRYTGILLLLFLGAAASTQAQNRLLPDSFGAWSATAAAAGEPTNFPASLDSQTALMKEAGARVGEARTYTNGAKQIGVSIVQAHDPSAAYEIYTFELQPGMKKWDLSQMEARTAAWNGELGEFLEGSFVVAVSNPRNASSADLAQLVKALGARADKTPGPPIASYLPSEGLVAGTERYALGPEAFRLGASAAGRSDLAAMADVLGFSSGAETMLAQYKSGGREAILLLIDYPTPQLAELHLHHLSGELPKGSGAGEPSIERKGSLLSIVLGPNAAAYAEKLRNEVKYQTQVTWNEPSQTATDPPITSTLVKIIMGTMVFMVVAVVLGVAFGGVRIVTKRLFPGMVFDRKEQMEVLQLGLTGKPIDPSDFY